ncbi:MAG TPA: hypothetical protein VF342_07580 [Alphaproteobacteria bacterium]
MAASPEIYRRIYDNFRAAISRYDCGQKCAPHNNGEPVCCTTKHAVPIVDKSEWKLLRSRTDLWRPYKPQDAAGREIVSTLHKDCKAVECKGARFCERDNRSMSCRTFPFFPYFTRAREFVGLAYYWTFEDRCWIMSNLQVVDPEFIREFIAAYELLFQHDEDEKEGLVEHSAYMRRVFTRWNRIIPLIGRDGGYLAVEPRTHVIRPARLEEFERHGPYKDEPPVPAAPPMSAAAE